MQKPILSKSVNLTNHRHIDGEGLFLSTEVFHNGDNNIDDALFTYQKIVLNFYCSSASISLFPYQITPDGLRKVADELEDIIKKAKEEYALHQERSTSKV